MAQQKVETITVTGKGGVQLRSTYSTAPFNVLGGALFQSEIVLKNQIELPVTPPEGAFYYSNNDFWGYCGPLRGWVSWTQDSNQWDTVWEKWKLEWQDTNPWKPFYGLENDKIEGWTLGRNSHLAIGKEFTQDGVSLEVAGNSILDNVQVQGTLRCEHGVRVGNHSKTVQGMIRYHNGEFQGYSSNGWVQFHSGSLLRWVEPVDWMIFIQEGEDNFDISVSPGDRVWVVIDKKKPVHYKWFEIKENSEWCEIEETGNYLGVTIRNCIREGKSESVASTVYFLQGEHVLSSVIQVNQPNSERILTDVGLQCQYEETVLPQSQTFTLSPGSIEGEHLKNQLLDSRHFCRNSVRGEFIVDNAIHPRHLSAKCFNADHLGENVIRSTHIHPSAITSVHLSDGCLREHHLPSNGFQASSLLAKGSILPDMLAEEIITSNKLSKNVIQGYHLPSRVIQSEHLSSRVICSEHIGDGIIQGRHIERGSIGSDIFRAESLHGSLIQTGTGRAEWFRPGTLPGWLIKTGTLHGSLVSESSIDLDKIVSTHRGFHVQLSSDSIFTCKDWIGLGETLEIQLNKNVAVWERVSSEDISRGWTFVRRAREDLEIGDRTVFERLQWSDYGYHQPWLIPEARWSQIDFFGNMKSQGVWRHEGPWHQRGILNLEEATVQWSDYTNVKAQLNRVWSHALYDACPRGVIVGWAGDEAPSGWKFLDIPGPNESIRWIEKVNVVSEEFEESS